MPADNRQSADQLLTDRKQQLLAFVDKQNFTFSPCNPNPFVFQEKHELLYSRVFASQGKSSNQNQNV